MIAALYSDQLIAENAAMDLRLAASITARGSRIGYVSSGPDPERSFFDEKRQYYARYELNLDVFIDLDDLGEGDIAALLSCNAIHLSGGDTAAFLARLRRREMLAVLRDWTLNDGILIGTSAGAILMTPDIALDALFSGGSPEAMRDGAALNLLPFEFFPHLNWDASYLPALLRYSEISPRAIIVCRDGEGVFVEEDHIEAYGAPLVIRRGAVDTFESGRLVELFG
jgi:dipeptidase E